jgi:hypothetical protein
MGRKYAVLFFVIIILSFLGILFAFGIFPFSDLNDKNSFDIHKEIEILNEDRTNKFTIVADDWLELKQGQTGSDYALYERKNSWSDFKESLESTRPTPNYLSLDENNKVIWYGILPVTYFEY